MFLRSCGPRCSKIGLLPVFDLTQVSCSPSEGLHIVSTVSLVLPNDETCALLLSSSRMASQDLLAKTRSIALYHSRADFGMQRFRAAECNDASSRCAQYLSSYPAEGRTCLCAVKA